MPTSMPPFPFTPLPLPLILNISHHEESSCQMLFHSLHPSPLSSPTFRCSPWLIKPSACPSRSVAPPELPPSFAEFNTPPLRPTSQPPSPDSLRASESSSQNLSQQLPPESPHSPRWNPFPEITDFSIPPWLHLSLLHSPWEDSPPMSSTCLNDKRQKEQSEAQTWI